MNKSQLILTFIVSSIILQTQIASAERSHLSKSRSFLKEQTRKESPFQASDLVRPTRGIIRNQTFRNINLTGANASLSFNKIKVLNNAIIHGPITQANRGDFKKLTVIGNVNAKFVTAESLNITGNCTFQNLHVDQPSTIRGNISIVDGNLSKLYAFSGSIVLKNVNLDNLYVSPPPQGTQPVVNLQGNTSITRIEFKGKHGIVKKEPTVRVSQVVGGTIEKE